MKGYNIYYLRAQVPEWSEHYVNYTELKERLGWYAKRRRVGLNGDIEFSTLNVAAGGDNETTGDDYHRLDFDDDKLGSDASGISLSMIEKKDFELHLGHELQKSATHYKQLLVQLRKQRAASTSNSELEQFGHDIVQIFSFAVANIITVRQILLRYDGFVRTFDGTPLCEWDLMRQGKLSLFDQTDIEEIKLSFLSQIEYQEQHILISRKCHSSFDHFYKLLDTTLMSVERAAGGHVVFRERVLSSIRQYFLIGFQRVGLSLEPKILHMKGCHLKKEMKMLALWNTTKQLPQEEDESDKMDPENVWPLILNLISCFLFMMNNYIIEPSSAYYANALGSSDALSGIMIGAAPWFALLSAVGYSFWTNSNYKAPILFAGFLMVIGNTLYACAYSFQSMEMCLLGRAITGLGAPRVINRRYVADATPFALRTAASAAFALTTALGAALGPGLAILLDMAEFQFDPPLLRTQYFNGMTGPGYFMALCWLLYSCAVLFTFKEPNRSGLAELKRREDESSGENDGSDDQSTTYSVVETKPPQNTSSPMYCIRNMTHATALCMLLIFMKRIALESIVGSTSIVTKNRYVWTIKNVGTLHLVNGLIVIPISILAGWLSQFREDRFLAIWFMSITVFGMIFLVDFSDMVDHSNEAYNDDSWLAVGPWKYITGSLISFSGVEACESFVASLMSKVVPSALAVGTFNSGLLATLVGTSGRAVGDLFITTMALISIRNLLNLLIVPGIVLMLVSIFLVKRNYEMLAV